jgi:hypothetical protein
VARHLAAAVEQARRTNGWTAARRNNGWTAAAVTLLGGDFDSRQQQWGYGNDDNENRLAAEVATEGVMLVETSTRFSSGACEENDK